MRYIDTHCHLDQILEKTGHASFDALRAAEFGDGFEACITISCDPGAIDPTLALLDHDGVFAAFGIHPHDAKHYTPELAARLGEALRHPKCVAYGEIGLDYHYDLSPRDAQAEAFGAQIDVALAAGKPLVIHTREAEDDTLALMKERVPADWPIHVHCFTSSRRLAEALLERFPNLCIGFTGIVTFKNSEDLRETARVTPLDRMLVETDGPYLAPVPHRGKPAHCGHVPLVIEKLAEIKALPAARTAEALRANAKRLYRL